MSDATSADPDVPASDEESAARMLAIAAALNAAGLTARVHDTKGVLDVTATAEHPGSKPVEIIADDDGYVQLSYWNPPGATPAEVTAAILRVLAAITSSPS